MEWEVSGLSSLDATGSGTIQVRVTNTGNTALSHQLTLETSKGLNAVIVGEDIVNAAGDSQQFTIQLSGTSTGTQQLTFALDGVQAVDSSPSSISIDVTASFEETDAGSNTVVFNCFASCGCCRSSCRSFDPPWEECFCEARNRVYDDNSSPATTSSNMLVCRGPISLQCEVVPVVVPDIMPMLQRANRLRNGANCGASAEQFVMA